MDRRAYLAAAVGLASGLAGCSGSAGESSPTATRSPTDTATARTLAERGVPSTICEEELPDSRIVAITDPAFADDWEGVAQTSDFAGGDLADDDLVIGLEHDGRARAYPLPVLWTHEVVNDSFGGPVLVTFCPLCDSGMVAERIVDGEPTAFGVSGLLWKPPGVWTAASEKEGRVFGVNSNGETDVRNSGNLVMYDSATVSYWSQMLAQGICGPRQGERLAIRPSTTATWAEWREAHPGTDVLLPPPHSTAENPPATGGS